MSELTALSPAPGSAYRNRATGRTWTVASVHPATIALADRRYGEQCTLATYVTPAELADEYESLAA